MGSPIRYAVFFGAMMFAFHQDTKAQLRNNYQEVWPAIDVYYRINPKLRLYGTVAGTKKESSYADGAVGVFIDYFTFPFAKLLRLNHSDSLPGRLVWLRAGYQYSATPPSAEDPFKENMLVTELNGRWHLPYNVLISVKNRFDWRFNNGDFNGRYRPRISLDRDMQTEYLYFTVSAMIEYYANFGNPSVNRFRSQLGVEFKVTRRMNFEVFWSHQFEHAPEIPVVDAAGATIKFYFRKNNIKRNNNT